MPEKQLKIYSLEENFSIKQAMALFQKQNPDVYVKYEYTYAFLEKDSSMTVTDALKNLNVELLSGTVRMLSCWMGWMHLYIPGRECSRICLRC